MAESCGKTRKIYYKSVRERERWEEMAGMMMKEKSLSYWCGGGKGEVMQRGSSFCSNLIGDAENRCQLDGQQVDLSALVPLHYFDACQALCCGV